MDDWLDRVARAAMQADMDMGGAPMSWLAQAKKNRDEAIVEFGQAAWDRAYAVALKDAAQ